MDGNGDGVRRRRACDAVLANGDHVYKLKMMNRTDELYYGLKNQRDTIRSLVLVQYSKLLLILQDPQLTDDYTHTHHTTGIELTHNTRASFEPANAPTISTAYLQFWLQPLARFLLVYTTDSCMLTIVTITTIM
jgi:hypothetical protein